MKSLLSARLRDRRQGLALIIVITTISLISVLVVAIFSITRTEYKATQGFVAARSAKQLGDISTAIVQAQIQNAHRTKVANTPTDFTIHATQPGMVRVYNAVGQFQRAYKLYSSSVMTVTGVEANVFAASQQAPTDWNLLQNKARFVDLNEPVIRPSRTAGTYSVYFPVIDPRAAYNTLGAQGPGAGNTTQVEGFSYSKATVPVGSAGSVNYNEVVLPTEAGGDPNKLRLPMPVEWLYVLRDGTTGTLDDSFVFQSSSPGIEASAQNPIVGRIAFWTDDESCKVNINTASEPTFFAPPYFYHSRDYQWANFPPATGEFQRYPGHPATVALSAVFAPGVKLDPLAPNANVDDIVATKEQIYELAPKIAKGGSKSGTLPFVRDDFSAARGEESLTGQVSDVAASRSERLYANVDDLLFKEGAYDVNGRLAAKYQMPGQGSRFLFNRETIERSRFFLTANSRAPEFTMHGLPRITMWPVADEGGGANRRTSFDNMIALCSTLQPSTGGAAVENSYIFRRAQPHHPTHDVTGSSNAFPASNGLKRNSLLLQYLTAQMSNMYFPATSSSGTVSWQFDNKYGNQNVRQLAIQFFDYIRSTNLYDGVLARENNGIDGVGKSSTALYTLNDQKFGTQRTYTNHRMTQNASGSLKDGTQTNLGNNLITDDKDVFPGHGTVTPAVWSGGDGNSYRGFGRMMTISELGFQFICTADGRNDKFAITIDGVQSGGGSAPKSDPSVGPRIRAPDNGVVPDQIGANERYYSLQSDQNHKRWFSNFPPLIPQDGSDPPSTLYGCDPAQPNKHPSRHPGYNPEFWNMTLENMTPLADGEKRIQMMLLLESFCPMLGWTKMYPEFAIELDGDFIAQMRLNGQRLFDTTQDVVIKSNGNIYESGTSRSYSLGGHAGPSQMAARRDGRPVSGQGAVLMPSDPGFDLNNTSGHNALTNYGLNSNFITVQRDRPMNLTFGQKELVIKLYDSHLYKEQALAPMQIIRINMTDAELPVPALAYSMQRGNLAFSSRELRETYQEDSAGRLGYWRALPGPHWWCVNSAGCLNRLQGQVNPAYTPTNGQPFWIQAPTPLPPGAEDSEERQVQRGRLDTRAQHANHIGAHGSARGVPVIVPENLGTNTGLKDIETDQDWSGFDVIRTMVPAVGDYRHIAARYDVPASMWKRHPVWVLEQDKGVRAKKTIHSFTSHLANVEPGDVLGHDTPGNYTQSLVSGAPYSANRLPDLPPYGGWPEAANSFGDFDNGIANSRDGGYVNKPDEGNFFAGNHTRFGTTKFYRSGYFFDPWKNSDDWRSGVYMTPNRMVNSPVMFGSLPTGVWPGGGVPTSVSSLAGGSLAYTDGRPWQTLLFRPHVQANASVNNSNHPGNYNPRDHNLLDMFTMPVVEPYAISEPLSVAGRVNLNYQIMPFTNIRRATALHAVMKGEFMAAIPLNADVNSSKQFMTVGRNVGSDWTGGKADYTWDETSTSTKKFWHRPINVNATLGQFDLKFRFGASGGGHSTLIYNGLFRTASQICEMHLIPDVSGGTSVGEAGISNLTALKPGLTDDPLQATVQRKESSVANVVSAMSSFWQSHAATGDNTRERPYSNIYPRVTTRSNTFRVHIRAQMINKARSVAANTFDPIKDSVVSEYRGSSLIERFIDPNNTANPLPDYGASNNPQNLLPLEAYYQFRTLETKRFSP